MSRLLDSCLKLDETGAGISSIKNNGKQLNKNICFSFKYFLQKLWIYERL